MALDTLTVNARTEALLKNFITPDEIMEVEEVVIDLSEIPRGKDRQPGDSYESLKAKIIKSLGSDEKFVQQQWKVMESYVWTKADRRGRAHDVANANFGTLESLFSALSEMDNNIEEWLEDESSSELWEDDDE